MTTLRAKIISILALLLSAVGAISFGVSSTLLEHSSEEFERRADADQFTRVELALNQEVAAAVRNVVNRAVWDDAALHVRRLDETYMDKNFTTLSLEKSQTYAAAFFTLSGKLHSSVDIRNGQRRALQADSALAQAMRSVQTDPSSQTAGNAKRWVDGKPVVLVLAPCAATSPGPPMWAGW